MSAVGGRMSLSVVYRGTVVRTAQRIHYRLGRTALGLSCQYGSTAQHVYWELGILGSGTFLSYGSLRISAHPRRALGLEARGSARGELSWCR